MCQPDQYPPYPHRMTPVRAHRLESVWIATCNGGTDNRGCGWCVSHGTAKDIRDMAREHASLHQHETVTENRGVGTAYDGRNR